MTSTIQNAPSRQGNYDDPRKTDRNIIIRPARSGDAAALADLHFRAYYSRYFDPATCDRNGKPYGAPLAEDFPALARGQNRDYFRAYWDYFVCKLSDPDPRRRNYCFVAVDGDRILAFVKGSGLPAIDDDSIGQTLTACFNNAASCGELGSIYCDPAVKYAGLGRRLAAEFAATMRDLGYDTMITRAYARNDSPEFFRRLGAQLMGECPIANDYLDENGRTNTLAIPGVWLYWDSQALEQLGTTASNNKAARPPPEIS